LALEGLGGLKLAQENLACQLVQKMLIFQPVHHRAFDL